MSNIGSEQQQREETSPQSPKQGENEVGDEERQQALDDEALLQKFCEEANRLTLVIPTDRIVQDLKFQIRMALNEGAVRAYQRLYHVNPALLPPVEVANVDGAYYLIDGWHRIEALRRLGRNEVAARIRVCPTIEDAMWIGGTINAEHGVRLTRDERLRRFKLYLQMGKHFIPSKPQTIRWVKSYRKIGEDFGMTHHTAEKLVKWADRKLWEALAERGAGQLERTHSGGLRTPKRLRPEDLAKRNLDNVRAAFQGIKSPEARGEVIAKTEQVAEDMKQGQRWTPFKEESEF